MREMERFIQASSFLIFLTLISAAASSRLYLSLLLCGSLLLLFSVRSLAEQENLLLLAVQTVLSAAFALLSGGAVACLIFYECRGSRSVQLVLPSAFYFAVALLMQKQALPQILFHTLLLLLAALLLLALENWIVSYISAKDRLALVVRETALNELYEKKLNQELVMKNYLAEKNARLEERERISRNIHNGVGHSVTAAILMLDAADLLFDISPERAREKMNAANQRIRTSLQSIRRAVRVLDSESEWIAVGDWIGEMTAVADAFAMDTKKKITTDLSDVSPSLMLPREHTEFLTGALQELLTNGVRHGNADSFAVSLLADSRHIRLGVSDNGESSFSPASAQEEIQRGFGLKKLISYAERCGGTAVFANTNGFHAVITLPLYERVD
ncbi:MAG: histidine kinase [Lachnospiraceae bacterium]|nr:histidine kinase [Lachnospiraceae bacterium]